MLKFTLVGNAVKSSEMVDRLYRGYPIRFNVYTDSSNQFSVHVHSSNTDKEPHRNEFPFQVKYIIRYGTDGSLSTKPVFNAAYIKAYGTVGVSALNHKLMQELLPRLTKSY